MKRKTTWILSYSLFFTGLFLIMLSILGEKVYHWEPVVSAFVRDIGLLLSAVTAGSLLHEKLLREEMVKFTGEELAAQLDKKITSAKEISELTAQNVLPLFKDELSSQLGDKITTAKEFSALTAQEVLPLFKDELSYQLSVKITSPDEVALITANKVHQLFKESPPQMTGLRLLADTRRNFPGYYQWVNEHRPQDLFFAGRSVLHRIDADIKANTVNQNSNAEEIILRRIKEGSKVKILFLDPRSDIIDRLAKEEGQRLEAMVGDVLTSLEIVYRLYVLISKSKSLSNNSLLTIRIYDKVPYFAYHKQDDEIIVGFYFSSDVGSSSAAYDIVDDETKHKFGDHFQQILSDASDNSLLEFDGARGQHYFNQELFENLCAVCKNHLK